jgi:hypothetical protein
MSGAPDTVECQICGESFDPSQASGYCTNPDCGEWQWEPDSSGSGDTGSGGGEGQVKCPDCGSMVPDRDYCKECGAELTGSEEGPESPTCPNCGEEVEEDWAACINCGVSLDDDGDVDDDEDEDTTDTGPASTQPQEVVVEVGDVEITATDGETVGKKVRSAYVRTGADEQEAQYIHREHVRVEQEGADFYLVNKGRNGTKLNGEELDIDERQKVEEGDTIEFSNRATGEIHLQ